MGLMNAISMAATDLSIEDQIGWHLQYNHYPPVCSSMVEPCIQAIEAAVAQELDREIELPEGIAFKDGRTVLAYQVVESLHLDSWIQEEET